MKPRSRSVLALESLESRLAPAVTIVNATTATFTDIDGDLATVKVSAGTLTAGLFTTAAKGLGDQLQTINFSAGGFEAANLTISATKVATGDGLVNVGYINSTGHDLGIVTVAGDVGQVDAGDSDPAAAAVASLTLRSLGRYGIDTQAGGGALESNFNGALGTLVVKADVAAAFANVDDGTDGTIGSVSIGGSLIGGSSTQSGRIFSSGDMGLVKIGHDLQGGTGGSSGAISSLGKLAGVTIGGSLFGGSNTNSGLIFSTGDMGLVKIGHDLLGGTGGNSGLISGSGKLAGVSIGGSLIGGSNTFSGAILSSGDMGAVKIGHVVQGGSGGGSGLIQSVAKLAGVSIGGSLIGGSNNFSGAIGSGGDMGPVKIGHDVQGGSASDTGRVSCGGKLAGVTIGGSLIGGSATNSGAIGSGGDVGPIKIGHDFQGGSISGTTGNLNASGAIQSSGRIASVVIGGSIVSGIDASTAGSLFYNASIRAANDIGSFTVKGSLIGNTNANGDSPVIISARGQAVPGATTDLAIGKLTIGRRVENARILAGYDTLLTPKNADAQIGAVTVGGDWAGSSIAAGAVDGGNGFGNANDAKISGAGTTDSAGIVSKIGSIAIKGLVYGTPGGAADHFGFVAQQIGSFHCLGFTAALTAATDAPLELALTTGDVTNREVA
jgi:hypothetical protein